MQIANNEMPAIATEGGIDRGKGMNGGRIALKDLPVLGASNAPRKVSSATPLSLPVPPFPRHPEKCGNVEPDPKLLPREGNPHRTSVTLPMIRRALRGWLYPYLGSRVKPGDFHPIISYLFTEWKCNLDCPLSLLRRNAECSAGLRAAPGGWPASLLGAAKDRAPDCRVFSGRLLFRYRLDGGAGGDPGPLTGRANWWLMRAGQSGRRSRATDFRRAFGNPWSCSTCTALCAVAAGRWSWWKDFSIACAYIKPASGAWWR